MIYAIGDLHLGLALDKPMDRFGAAWAGHHLLIAEHWRRTVTEADTVILTGDSSWAMREDDFAPDFAFLQALPGRKVLVQGNHDYWWASTGRLNALDANMLFLKSSFTRAEGLHICGTRGWLCPGAQGFTAQDEKLYRRELLRMRRALEAAMTDGAADILVAMHFPPMNEALAPSGFTDLFTEFPVRQVVYGHLHGEGGFARRVERESESIHGVRYRLVSCDYLQFQLANITAKEASGAEPERQPKEATLRA